MGESGDEVYFRFFEVAGRGLKGGGVRYGVLSLWKWGDGMLW